MRKQKQGPTVVLKTLVLFLLLAAAVSLFFTKTPTQSPNPNIDKTFRIGIFKADGFPARAVPQGFGPDFLAGILRNDYTVVFLDELELADPHYLNREDIDFLALAYGESFPSAAFQNIKNFIYSGGGLVTTAGVPFSNPLRRENGKWIPVPGSDFSGQYLMPLGIRHYTPTNTPGQQTVSFEPQLIKQETAGHIVSKGAGLCITVSQGRFAIRPDKGNTFPARTMVRDLVPLLGAINPDKQKTASLLSLVKTWENPFTQNSVIPNKWLLCSFKGEGHPFSPALPGTEKLIKDCFRLLTEPALLSGLRTDRASYEKNETPTVTITAHTTAKVSKAYTIKINVHDFDSNKLVFTGTKEVKLEPGANTYKFELAPEHFANNDLFRISVTLVTDKRAVDTIETALVMSNLQKDFPALSVKDGRFELGGRPILLNGTNYYESKRGELNWLDPEFLSIARDFSQMAAMGLKIVRIHYHHPDWFYDRYNIKKEKLIAPLLKRFHPVRPGKNSPVPGEEFLRILDTHIQLANRFGLVFSADLFSLVPENMGSCQGWLGIVERCLPRFSKHHKEFAKAVAQRYKDVPGISWDLWNEPSFEDKDIEKLRTWAQELVSEFRKHGDTHLITIGGNNSLQLEDILDYTCLHTDFSTLPEIPQNLTKPFIIQEAWIEAGLSAEEEILQSDKLKKDYRTAMALGAQGFMPWQWTRQARLWDRFEQAEKWDNCLGCISREDASVKPAGQILKTLLSE